MGATPQNIPKGLEKRRQNVTNTLVSFNARGWRGAPVARKHTATYETRCWTWVKFLVMDRLVEKTLGKGNT